MRMADSDNESGGRSTNKVTVNSGGEWSSAREQDRLLPIANVSRIMKKALPANAKISKDAKETLQECVSEFISFITGEASDKCLREKRKTINGDDLLWAMSTLGFEEYVEPLKLYLHKFREMEGEKATSGGGGSPNSSICPQSQSQTYQQNINPTTTTTIIDHGMYGPSAGKESTTTMMMMGQQMYGEVRGGAPPSSSNSYQHQMGMRGGKGSLESAGGS